MSRGVEILYALIQEDDIKSKMLAKEIDEIELYRMKGSTNLIPIYLLREIFKRRKRPEAVILRYLNDSTSFLKSLIRVITNIITVVLTVILRIKLIWICHNVDRESKEYFPLLVKIRRKIVTRFSEKILVTDKLLVKHAVKFLGIEYSKVDYITFGRPIINNVNTDSDVHRKILEFVYSNNKPNTLVGFSIGNPNKKVLQPFYTNNLINSAANNGINVKIILGGPIGDFIKKKDVKIYESLLSNPNVLFLDGKIKINEEFISKHIDFYWRVYDDFSVPYTVYNAVFLNKPILTMKKGFLNEMVEEYKLGTVLDMEMSNIVKAFEELRIDREKIYKKFISNHNWSYGASKLLKVIKC